MITTNIGGPAGFILGIIMALVVILPFWTIFSKAGYNGALSLLLLIPIINLIIIYVFAFVDWPCLKNAQQH